MARKKTSSTSKKPSQKPRSVAVTPPIMAETPSFSIAKIRQNKPLMGAIGFGVIVILLLAFPLRFLIIPALVNGQPIFSWQYVGELHKRAGNEVLTQMINQKLIEQEISAQSVQVTQAEIDKQLKQVEDQIGTESGGLDAMLSLQGMTKADLIKQIRLNQSLEKLVKNTITLNEEEIQAELKENADTYKSLSEVDAATSAAENLRQTKMNSAFTQWFQKIRSQAKITNYFETPLVPLPQSPSVQ